MRRTISTYLRSYFSRKCRILVRYAHSQTSSFETPGSLSKFTPLPNKWSTGDHVYTGKPAGSTSISYYGELLDPSTIPEKSAIYSDIMRSLNRQMYKFPVIYIGGRECRNADLKTGDIIETCNRHGKTKIGVILNTDNDKIEYLTFESEKLTLSDSSTVVMILKEVYQPTEIWNSLQSSDTSAYLWHLSLHLKLLIRDSLALSQQISAKQLPAVLANVSRRTGLTTIDFENAASLIYRKQWSHSGKHVKQALAFYFSMCFADLRVCRPSLDTGFLSMSPTLYAAVNKVMNNTSQFELDQCVKLIASKIAGRETHAHVTALFAPFLVFFHHYILCADPRLAPAVSTFLSKVYPDVDSDSWLTSPSNVHKMLVDAGFSETYNPFLNNTCGICWKDHSGLVTDDLEKEIIEKYKEKDRVVAETKYALYQGSLFTFRQSRDLAISVDFNEKLEDFFDPNAYHDERPISGTIHIHLPNMTTLGEVSSSLIQTIFKRTKTLELPQGTLHLLPEIVRNDYNFHDETATSLMLSIPFEKINEDFEVDWNSCQVSFVELTSQIKPQIIDAREFFSSFEDLSLELQISYDLFRWHFRHRIQKNAVQDYSAASEAYSIRIHNYQYSGLHMIQEARVLAGCIFGEYCAKNKISVPFLVQDQKKGVTSESFDLLSIQRQIDGTIADKDLSQIKHRYLGLEKYTQTSGSEHVGLGCTNYVDIGHPLDNSMHILAQYNFRGEKLESLSGCRAAVERQSSFMDWFRDRLISFHKLNLLQNELFQLKEGYFIFRCVILGQAKYPELAKGYCHELGMTVDIAMLPSTMLHPGNTVVCTEILELNPVDGMLVIGL